MHTNQHTIDIWKVNLDVDDITLDIYKTVLDDEETARTGRLKNDENRRRFIVARSNLRTILSRYTGTAPENLRFRYNSNGKPFLILPEESEKIYFNLTHSGELALVAVTSGGYTGIDIEEIKQNIDFMKLAKRFFQPNEFKILTNLPEHQRKKAFYRCWTRKEAYIKARGMGIWQLLDKVEVSLAPGKPAELLANTEMPDDVRTWHIFDLEETWLKDDYVAAVAIENDKPNFDFRDFQTDL